MPFQGRGPENRIARWCYHRIHYVASATLAFGIGAATAIFSVVNGVLLHPMSYGEPERLVLVSETDGEKLEASVSAANLIDWRKQTTSFEGLAAVFPGSLTLTGVEEPERLRGLQVTPNFFRVLGVDAELGRTFLTEDEGAIGQRPVVLSHDFWLRQFGAAPSVIGRVLALDGAPHTVVGVMPSGFQFVLEEADVWIRPPRGIPVPPIGLDEVSDIRELRELHWLRVIGRLEPAVSVNEAGAEMDVIARRLAEEYPEENAGRGAHVVSLHERLVGDVQTALFVLAGAVGLLLLIACA